MPAAPSTGRTAAELTEVTVDSQTLLGYVVQALRSVDVLASNTALVADAFDHADIPYVVLRAVPGEPRTLVVARDQRARALGVLAEQLGQTASYAVEARRGARAAVIEDWPEREPEAITVFRARATAAGRLLAGPDLGCRLQFWDRSNGGPGPGGEVLPVGTLIGPRNRTPVLDQLPPEVVTEPAMREVDGRPRPTPTTLELSTVFDTTVDIDAVYTWVDGSDPAWQQAKATALAAEDLGALSAVAANDLRFVSRDELKYSLRSLEMYADWFRHVYLVTADQVPPWLEVEHPRITVVSHRELFGDRGRLPTFSSHAIETQLHHIDGLAEHFVYLNDDVFFGRPVPPSTFVLGNGTTRFFPSTLKITPGSVSVTDRPFAAAAKNGRDLIEQRFGRSVTQKLQHTPHALRRSVQRDLEAEFADAVNRTAATPFRSATDVSMAAGLGHYYGYLTGRATTGRVRYLYLDVAQSDIEERLGGLLETRDVDVFCLNDNESGLLEPAEQQRIMIDFLEAYYPFPSRFEKQTAQGC